MCPRFELDDKSLFSVFWLCVCLVRRRPRSERRGARQRAILWAGERGPVPRPRARRTGLPRRLRRRQVQSHPSMHVSVLVFINTTQWPVYKTAYVLLAWKHGWIATPWFVITIPWPPRLMSDFAWTLIDIRMLRTLLIIRFIFIKKMCVYGKG